jgi:hypothetical protein
MACACGFECVVPGSCEIPTIKGRDLIVLYFFATSALQLLNCLEYLRSSYTVASLAGRSATKHPAIVPMAGAPRNSQVFVPING